jgi:hypothetical protein
VSGGDWFFSPRGRVSVLGFNEFFSVHAAKGLGAAPISNLIGTSAARVERPISSQPIGDLQGPTISRPWKNSLPSAGGRISACADGTL